MRASGENDDRIGPPRTCREAKERLERLERVWRKMIRFRNMTPADGDAIRSVERAINKAKSDMKKSQPHGVRGQGTR